MNYEKYNPIKKKRLFIRFFFLFLILILIFSISVNATYLKLTQDKNLADSSVTSNNPDLENGASDVMTLYEFGALESYLYLMFNITAIPPGSTINHANISIYSYLDALDDATSIHEVNITWDEATITWNNQPCGVGFDNASNCNLTAESSHANPDDDVFDTWNITGMLQHALDLGRDNLSVAIVPITTGEDADNYRSRQYVTVAERPFAEVDYTEAVVDTTSPSFTNNQTNNTAPRIIDVVNFNITLSDTDNVSGFIFSWDNGTGTFKNDSFVSIQSFGYTVANVSVNKTIEVEAGTDIQYKWHANDTLGNMGNSGTARVQVSGTLAPNITTNSNNFFNGTNTSIIGFNQSNVVLINLTFTDDIALFGFDITIKNNRTGTVVYSITNNSLTGTIDTFATIVNVSGSQDYYIVNVTSKDAHTKELINNFDISKGLNYLEYDNAIKITAEGAIWSNTKKRQDRYTFEFTYLPFIGPKVKTFYIESDSKLYYMKDSEYKGHFVDPKNNKWIDFEGIEGKPTITKISDTRWKIVFNNKDSKVIFNSIGALNTKSEFYLYYLSNPTLDWFIPETTTTSFFGSSFNVSLNVTGDGRNMTRINLYNSSGALKEAVNVTDVGIGTYFYNASFTGLTDAKYRVNATHFDRTGENESISTVIFNSIKLTDCGVGFPAINFTFRDEINNSRVISDATGTFNYNGSNPTETFTIEITDQNNFTVCINPPGISLVTGYDIIYSATDYQQRTFSIDSTILSNKTDNKTLYLLNLDDGIFGRFQVVDQFQVVISGVDIEMRKTGESELQDTQITDDSGSAALFVNPDQTYDFIFTKTGYGQEAFSLRITSSDVITVTMTEEGEAVVEPFSTAITYKFLPENLVLDNGTDYDFIFNMTSSFWEITDCTLSLKNESETLSSSSCFSNASMGDVLITFNTGNQTTIISEAIYELNSTTEETVSVQYKVQHTFQGEYSLMTFLDDISAFASAGFNDFTRMMIAFFIIFGIVAFASFNFTELRDPESLIILTWALVLFFSYISWLTVNYEAIPEQIAGLSTGWLRQYIIFILITLGGGSYLLRKHI